MTFPSHRHEHRVTVLMNCSIGVSREANRHRTFSISEQSTRYCNYSRDKFGNEITYVIPQWIYKTKADWEDCVDSLSGSPLNYLKGLTGESLIKALSCHDRGVNCWISILRKIESDYTYLIREEKFKPQEARSILPLDTATSVYYTAYVSDWQHFFKLRCSEAAHPDIKVLADDLQKKFKEANLI